MCMWLRSTCRKWESELKDIRKVEKAIETFAIYSEKDLEGDPHEGRHG